MAEEKMTLADRLNNPAREQNGALSERVTQDMCDAAAIADSHAELVKALETAAFALELVQTAVWEGDKRRLTFAGLWGARAPIIDDAANEARAALAKLPPAKRDEKEKS